MFHLIYKYLISYKSVAIPGIGQFSFERHASRLITDENVLQAPATFVKFKTHTDVADKSFYTFLAREMNVDSTEATRLFKEFASQLKTKITGTNSVELPSLGTLGMVNNEITFQPRSISNDYYPDINLSDSAKQLGYEDPEQTEENLVTSVDEEHSKSEGKSWLIYALILGLIGAAAIAYYYLQVEN